MSATETRAGLDSLPEDIAPLDLEAAVRSLQRGDDWDGEGARGVSRDACEAALAFLAEVRAAIQGLPDPTSVSPSVSGAVAFSWRRGREVLLVEVAAEMAELLYHQWRGPKDQRSSGFVDRAHVVGLLRGLCA
ncbi:MAG TPA: hypothetical protein VK689_20965 [Armatimonadota bacterium]|nr:hypothetical protein [Armatimonadota bacterium]